jgi:sterol desaturase/sphingolipid hydroxylase (fatty acid hydroxylase superfamily)
MSEQLAKAIKPEFTSWLLAMLVVVLLAATLEGLVQTFVRRQTYDWRAYGASVTDAALRLVANALGLSTAAPLLMWAYRHRLGDIDVSSATAMLTLFLGLEFFYYWYHRAAHRIAWFWATHCVHHSPNELTLASALRLGWTGHLSGASIFFAPLIWLGFSPVAVLSGLAANLLYQFWLHATWIPRLGVLERVLNTPSHHRVHHGRNPEYLDCNYGGVLIVFDRLFKTHVKEHDEIVIQYGLTQPMRSHNPVYISLHYWWAMVRRAWLAPNWRHRLQVVLGPPL